MIYRPDLYNLRTRKKATKKAKKVTAKKATKD